MPASFLHSPRRHWLILVVLSAVWWFSAVPLLHASEHKRKLKAEDYGLGFSTEIAAPESEVLQAVEDVVNDGIIQGSKEFNKDKYIESATPADSSSLFPEWKGPGQIYYKVRTQVLAPLDFKDSRDQGTLAVRYVVQSKDDSKTIVHIDAVFVEDFLHTVHASDGSVENAESQDIQDRVDAMEAEKKQAGEREKQRQEQLAKQTDERKKEADEASALAAAQTSAQTLDQRVEPLRHQAERVVKAPGRLAEIRPVPKRQECEASGGRRGSRDPGRDSVIGMAWKPPMGNTVGSTTANWSRCHEAEESRGNFRLKAALDFLPRF